MALKRRTPKSESASEVVYENLPLGENEGRLAYVADLGLQARDYRGEDKPPAQQLSLGIEIVGQYVEIDGEKVPRLLWTKPFYIYSSLTEKGVELEYYKVFDPAAKPDGDANWEAQLGKPCNVIIEHTPGKGASEGKLFDNIANLTPIPAKYHSSVGEGEIEPAIGDADDENNVVTKALYGLAKYVYDKRIQDEPASDPEPQGNYAPGVEDDDDDVPF